MSLKTDPAHRVFFKDQSAHLAAVAQAGELANDHAVFGAAFAHPLHAIKQPVDGGFQFVVFWRRHIFGWFPSILQVLTIIRPETLVRWHRAGFRCYWRWRSRPLGGRPRITPELRVLIRKSAVGRAAHSRGAAQAWVLRSRSRASPRTWSSDAGRPARDGAPSCVTMRQTPPPWTFSLSHVSARHSEILRPLLQRRQNSSILGQGCAGLPPGSANRCDQFTRQLGRTSPPLHPCLGFRYTQRAKAPQANSNGQIAICN
jgi:hypothetical protein